MKIYDYGKRQDIDRFQKLRGGVHSCKLNKMPSGTLENMEVAEICDIDHPLASTVTARYHKGIGSHKDNMVLIKYE